MTTIPCYIYTQWPHALHIPCGSPSFHYTDCPISVNLSIRNIEEQEPDSHRHTRSPFFVSFHSLCPITLVSKADLQFWEASTLGIILIIRDPTLQTFTTESCSESCLTEHGGPPCLSREVQMVTDKAESSWVHHGSQNNSGFHLLTYPYLPHFPTSTPLYFPLTLANLNRQCVVGIYFHLVVVLEFPFSKQHDIIKTSAKDIF